MKILILIPPNIQKGQPSYERIYSFINFYKKNNLTVIEKTMPVTVLEKFKLINFLYKNSIKNIFISMPPFRNWFLFFLPRLNIIMDIRDGWSIAMKSGYGGTVKPNKIKAFIASLYERFAIRKSAFTITCTNGLKDYLETNYKTNIALIPNGYTLEDYNIVSKLKSHNIDNTNSTITKAVCAGQFSEYGQDTVKSILLKLSSMNNQIQVTLVGSDVTKNEWIYSWLKYNKIVNIELRILPRMDRQDMYKEISSSDYGLAVVRDPQYEFGTKVFDYILCGVPIFDYFDEENNFVAFFKEQLSSTKLTKFDISFVREDLIEKYKDLLIGCIV